MLTGLQPNSSKRKHQGGEILFGTKGRNRYTLGVNFTNGLDVEFSSNVQTPNLPVQPKPTPNNPHWTVGIAILVWLSSVFFIIIAQLTVFSYYAARMNTENLAVTELLENLKLDPTFILANVVAVFPAHILTLALAWIVITRFNRFSFTEMVGWKFGGFSLSHLLIIIGVFFALLFLANAFGPDEENELTRILQSSRSAVIVVSVLATFSAPIVEEVIYRGILFSAFRKTFGEGSAIAIVTFLFAIIHVPQYWPSAMTITVLCLLSLVLTLIRARTGNLLPCIVTHAVINGIQSLAMLANPSPS